MGEAENKGSVKQTVSDRRFIRKQYLAVKNLINDERDGISSVDSDMFKSIISNVENIHQKVYKPREQVADAEALLDIVNTFGLSVKAARNNGVTPSDFVTSLLQNFSEMENPRALTRWGDIGLFSSQVFNKAVGCCTMVGPMNNQMKRRKVTTRPRTKRPRVIQSACPKELDSDDVKNDTDKNMSVMFDILKKKRSVKLECLVLNRNSFAQTVENIFALSFLAKDGRVKIDVDDNDLHLVSPRNAPSANKVAKKEVSYFHFVFRFDFQDWKLMKDFVREGEELMPHRGPTAKSIDSPGDVKPITKSTDHSPDDVKPSIPIKKYSRNRRHELWGKWLHNTDVMNIDN